MRSCSSPAALAFQVQNGHFAFSQLHPGYPGKPSVDLQATIIGDGSLALILEVGGLARG